MAAPLIGITTPGQDATGNIQLNIAYINAVRRAGGIPVLLTPGEEKSDRLLAHLDGVLFTGGGDLHPQHYNGTSHPTLARIDLERDQFELDLARRALQSERAILGICRGLQVLSVASGVALVPHVPERFGSEVSHLVLQAETPIPTRHGVSLVAGSQMAALVGSLSIEIVSWHHQAITTIPPGWRVAAYAPDGLIEAIEHGSHPWAIAVQWHPELSAEKDPHQQRIFRAFVRAAQGLSYGLSRPA
ncbi:gamma-glutamyl-gamma-aminobutyrate hydrolase family protein [Leptolyngbya sp. FACHB-16]|nr:gamma-glutamyl-gamma-aminobutyrate hydrolase family protein [Leptolyngbya sp. FACHB-8]MBD2155522.1 gamma-glutamyl-gamma-aminobutyrate hydrolase family protein [Leptolyngbya sp. FACHB-16]